MNIGNGLPNPCHKCTKRSCGCAITCPDWKAYTIEREKVYEARNNKCMASRDLSKKEIR